MTLRIEAGDSVIGNSRDRLREPTGSPVGEIGFDDAPENLARSRVEGRKRAWHPAVDRGVLT